MNFIENDKYNKETFLSRAVERFAYFKLELLDFEDRVALAEFGVPHPELRRDANILGQRLPVRLEPRRCDMLFISLPRISEGSSTDNSDLFLALGVTLPYSFYGTLDNLDRRSKIEPLDLFNSSFKYYRAIKRRNHASEEELNRITAWQSELYKEFIESLPDLGVTLH